MPRGQRIAQALGGSNLIPSPTRSLMVQQLLAQSQAQAPVSRSVAESASIAAKPLIAALLAKREESAQQNQDRQTAGQQQALAAALDRSRDESLDPTRREAARRAAQIIAGGLPSDNPVVQASIQEQFSSRERRANTESERSLIETGQNLQGAREGAARVESRNENRRERDFRMELAEFERETAIMEAQARAASSGGDLSQSQYVAAGYAQRTTDANETFAFLDETGDDQTDFWTRLERNLPQGIKGDARQIFEQSERNFINATLRRESGAAIAESEFENARAQYIPQPGDTPRTLALKKRNRDVVMAALTAEAGPALDQLRQNLPPMQSGGGERNERGTIPSDPMDAQPGELVFNQFGQAGRVQEDGTVELIEGFRGGVIQR